VDISHLYTSKAELQNAADAAALAAASQLNSTSGGIRCAVAEATKALNNYDFGNNVTLTAADVSFSNNLNGTYISQASAETSATSMRFVKVTLPPKQVTMTFAALVINRNQMLTATATAGTSVGLTMNKFYTAYTFIEPAAAPLQKGQVYTLSPKNYNDSSPNSYRVLAGPDGDLILTGALHAYGYIGTNYTVAQLVSSEMCRYAKIGMNTRFGDYSVHPQANPTDEPPDTITQENITYQQYTTMQGNGVVQRSDGVRNRRIMTVPIAPNNTYDTSARTVVANKLAAFFVRRKVGTDCGLEVEYIGAPIAVPEGTFTPGSSQMGDLSIPVLYK
jgi:Flp pilus assembly protein TadG